MGRAAPSSHRHVQLVVFVPAILIEIWLRILRVQLGRGRDQAMKATATPSVGSSLAQRDQHTATQAAGLCWEKQSSCSFPSQKAPSLNPHAHPRVPSLIPFLLPGALVQHCSSFLSPCWQYSLLNAAPGSSPTKSHDVDSSRGAASS